MARSRNQEENTRIAQIEPIAARVGEPSVVIQELRSVGAGGGHRYNDRDPYVVVTAAAPPAAGSSPEPPSPAGSTAEALKHYHQALEALRNSDWQTFGTEMSALQKALEGAAGPP